jgi:hypothetical protein
VRTIRKTIPLLACLVLYTLSVKVTAQQQETILVVITAPQAVIPDELGNNRFDEEIKKLKERLPDKLETLIINISNRKIRFLERGLLMDLKEAINYEEPRGYIDAIPDSTKKKIEAVLLTKIEKTGASQISIKAKIVRINREILSAREIITYIEPQYTYDSNLESLATQIVKDLIPESGGCGLISLNEYIKEHDSHKVGMGFGFGYKNGNQVTLSNVPKDIRMTPPHADDVENRPDQILDPNVPDNYLVRENTVVVDLGHRMSLDLHLSFWGIANIALRTSSIQESEKIYDRNLLRKNYIRPSYTGDAFIYYSVRSKKRSFFSRESFSIPIYVTYPVYYCGNAKELVFHILAGTNILLPEKIEFEADQGWDRFGALENASKRDIGELRETQWFGGIDIAGTPTALFRLGIQFILLFPDYQENFNIPLSLKLDNRMCYSLRITVTTLLQW